MTIVSKRHRYQPILGFNGAVQGQGKIIYDEFLELIDAKIHESRRRNDERKEIKLLYVETYQILASGW